MVFSPEQLIQIRLKEGKRLYRSFTFGFGFLLFLNFLLLSTIAEMILDQAFNLNSWIRVFWLYTSLAIGLALLLILVVLPWFRKINELYIARLMERKYPQFKDSLSTYVDFSYEKEKDALGIQHALAKRASEVIQYVDPVEIIPPKRVFYNFLVLLGMTVFFILYSLVWGRDLTSFIKRAFFPLSHTPYPTATKIMEIKPKGGTILKGTNYTIQVRLGGVIPPKVWCDFLNDQGRDKLLMEPVKEKKHLYKVVIPLVERSFSYSIHAGDCISKSFKVKAVSPPIVEAVSVFYQYPAYLGFPNEEKEDGEIEAYEGSRITLRCTTNNPLKKARIRWNQKYFDRCKILSPKKFEYSFLLKKSGQYSFHIQDIYGFSNQDPVEYQVYVRKDHFPSVQILMPKKEELVLPIDKKLEIKFLCTDDFGLDSVTLYWAINGNLFQSAKYFSIPKGEKKFVHQEALFENEQIRQYWKDQFKKKILLKKGYTLEFWVGAQDTRVTGKKEILSKKYKVFFIEREKPLVYKKAKNLLKKQEKWQKKTLEKKKKKEEKEKRRKEELAKKKKGVDRKQLAKKTKESKNKNKKEKKKQGIREKLAKQKKEKEKTEGAKKTKEEKGKKNAFLKKDSQEKEKGTNQKGNHQKKTSASPQKQNQKNTRRNQSGPTSSSQNKAFPNDQNQKSEGENKSPYGAKKDGTERREPGSFSSDKNLKERGKQGPSLSGTGGPVEEEEWNRPRKIAKATRESNGSGSGSGKGSGSGSGSSSGSGSGSGNGSGSGSGKGSGLGSGSGSGNGSGSSKGRGAGKGRGVSHSPGSDNSSNRGGGGKGNEGGGAKGGNPLELTAPRKKEDLQKNPKDSISKPYQVKEEKNPLPRKIPPKDWKEFLKKLKKGKIEQKDIQKYSLTLEDLRKLQSRFPHLKALKKMEKKLVSKGILHKKGKKRIGIIKSTQPKEAMKKLYQFLEKKIDPNYQKLLKDYYRAIQKRE